VRVKAANVASSSSSSSSSWSSSSSSLARSVAIRTRAAAPAILSRFISALPPSPSSHGASSLRLRSFLESDLLSTPPPPQAPHQPDARIPRSGLRASSFSNLRLFEISVFIFDFPAKVPRRVRAARLAPFPSQWQECFFLLSGTRTHARSPYRERERERERESDRMCVLKRERCTCESGASSLRFKGAVEGFIMALCFNGSARDARLFSFSSPC
jgi:hypothetical protein